MRDIFLARSIYYLYSKCMDVRELIELTLIQEKKGDNFRVYSEKNQQVVVSDA